ncbi:MAG: DUF3298 and DUF4163 domain-containing protein [Clostridiales bacterium]|nr:DUF3298 and DUF4163 domain-containing protein [Clostridiales bacterium]
MIFHVDTAVHTKSEAMYFGGEPVLKYEINVPEFWSDVQGINRVNLVYTADLKARQDYCRGELYRAAVQDAADAIKNGFPVREYEYLKTFEVTCDESCVVSLYSDTYEFTGGAHGNTVRTSQTWRFPGGQRIAFASLFPRGTHYRAALIARIVAVISRNPEPYFEDYKKLVAENFSSENFYLTPRGIAVYFQQYEIAPYSSGIPVFEFTYEALGATPPRCVR